MGSKQSGEVTSVPAASVASKTTRDPKASGSRETATGSAITLRVVKESSRTHSDALKRLVDRWATIG
ncbi:hypothetical protein SAMN05216227_100591 [Pseudorhodobacter antarcticus]|uniref:Uncharacterized protein n=1 Tax=Pseudorhodobacter antarcticus TaxID=1077947 RepID=A0A1H8CPL1_9RHOB|nr:hypothetical protein SAMN05216227_100591 [Pseudorhodobacter antarcticus]